MSDDFSAILAEQSTDQIKVVHLKGELDELSITPLKATIDPLLEDVNVKKVVMDFTELEFINSKGIGYLVSIHTHLTKDQRVLMIVAATEAVMDVISLVGLTTIIPYHATLQEALASA